MKRAGEPTRFLGEASKGSKRCAEVVSCPREAQKVGGSSWRSTGDSVRLCRSEAYENGYPAVGLLALWMEFAL